MTNSYLIAVFDGSGTIGYKNPVSWKCYEIRSCSNWKPTVSVKWNLPSTKYGVLYASDKCEAAGQYQYITDKMTTKSYLDLRKTREIKSMMVAEYLNVADRPSLTYSDKCSSGEEHGIIGVAPVEAADNVTYVSAWDTEYGSAEGNLSSSNWNDALPEMPREVGKCFRG